MRHLLFWLAVILAVVLASAHYTKAQTTPPNYIALGVSTSQPGPCGGELYIPADGNAALLEVAFYGVLDLNGNGVFDCDDLRRMADYYPDDAVLWGDLDCRGSVTAADYSYIKQHLGERVPSDVWWSSAALALGAAGGYAVGRRRV